MRPKYALLVAVALAGCNWKPGNRGNTDPVLVRAATVDASYPFPQDADTAAESRSPHCGHA